MQDKVVKEAVIIQNWVEDQSSKNIETINHLNTFVSTLQKTINYFVEGLEEGLEQYLEDQKELQFVELQRLYSYLGRMVKELISISKGMQNSLNKNVLPEIKSYLEHLQEKNLKTYETLCNHYKQTIVAYKMMDFKPDIEDIYNPVFKQRDILNKSRQKYQQTLKDFQNVNSDYLQFTKGHLKQTIRAINQILNLDGVQKYLSSAELQKPLIIDTIMPQLVAQIQDQLGTSKLLVISTSPSYQPNEVESQIQLFVAYLLSQHISQFRNYEETRSLILGNEKYSLYFMKQLSQSLKSDINLSLDKYHDIQSMIKFIYASMMQLEDVKQQLLINILRVAQKIQSQNKWLLKEFKGYQAFWKDFSLWKSLYTFIINSKQSKNNLKNYVRKIKRLSTIKWIKMKRFSFQKSTNQQQITLQIIRQLSMYMAALEIDNTFVIQTIISLCKSQDIPRMQIQRLIKYQQSNKKSILNQQYLKPQKIKQQKQRWWNQRKNRKIIVVVAMSLKYLNLGQQVLQIRLVSKDWNQGLISDIYRRYLEQQQSMSNTQKHRVKMYLMISNSRHFTLQQFKYLSSLVPKQFGFRQIINLDVRRSIQWNPSLQSTLAQILYTFAYNYPDTGYLQGMNYVVQNLLKITQKPHEVYKIFEFIMRNHYLHYYDNNFAFIRLRIYQLIRVIQIQMPDLARHFQKEKLEGEYFLLPWAITLWGQFKGQLSFVMKDGFIIDGWIWWIKVCLWVLHQKKAQFLQKRFQNIMKTFSELMSDPLFSQPLPSNNVHQQIISFNVTSQLLSKIQKQYICSNDQISQMMDQKSPFVSPTKIKRISSIEH